MNFPKFLFKKTDNKDFATIFQKDTIQCTKKYNAGKYATVPFY